MRLGWECGYIISFAVDELAYVGLITMQKTEGLDDAMLISAVYATGHIQIWADQLTESHGCDSTHHSVRFLSVGRHAPVRLIHSLPPDSC